MSHKLSMDYSATPVSSYSLSETSLHLWVIDADYSSLYPTISRYCNIARGTLATSAFKIEGRSFDDVLGYYSNLINLRENAETLCSKYHGMPTYKEMYNRVRKNLAGSSICK